MVHVAYPLPLGLYEERECGWEYEEANRLERELRIQAEEAERKKEAEERNAGVKKVEDLFQAALNDFFKEQEQTIQNRPPGPTKEEIEEKELKLKEEEKEERKLELRKHEIELERVRLLEEKDGKPPPLYSDEPGFLDTRDAAFFVVDLRGAKGTDTELGYRYYSFVSFAFDCHRRCALRLFTHPGDPYGLASFEGKDLQWNQRLHSVAITAIKEFNRICKGPKLGLKELIKVNWVMSAGRTYYMTFSATDQETGNTRVYQAAMANPLGQNPVLGLFRDCSTGKVLAIVSLLGADEDLAEEYQRLEYGLACCGLPSNGPPPFKHLLLS